MSRGWSAWLMLASAALLVSAVAVNGYRLAGGAWRSAVRLATMSAEERRLATYGDCGNRGYGYVRRIIDRLPDAGAMPRLRYAADPGYAENLMPGSRHRFDDRVLVTIGVRPEDRAQTRFTTVAVSSGGGTQWEFATGRDIDTVLGVRIDGRVRDADPRSVRLAVFSTAARRVALGQWDLTVPDGPGPWTLMLPAPLSSFSASRGAVPFAITLDGSIAASRLEVIAIPVDTRDYTEVNHDGACATLVRTDFLDHFDPRWSEWLTSVRQIAQ